MRYLMLGLLSVMFVGCSCNGCGNRCDGCVQRVSTNSTSHQASDEQAEKERAPNKETNPKPEDKMAAV